MYVLVASRWGANPISYSTYAAVGLGSEVTMGHTLMQYIAKNEHGVVIWHLAQMCFSLFLAVAFSAESGFGMPFLAVGLWKCDHTYRRLEPYCMLRLSSTCVEYVIFSSTRSIHLSHAQVWVPGDRQLPHYVLYG